MPPAPNSYAAFLEALAARESGGDYAVSNKYGYLGKYQFGTAALTDCGYIDLDGNWTGKHGCASPNDFLRRPEAQEAAIRKYIDVQWGYIRHFHLDSFLGTTVGGVVMTTSGMLAGAHLVGVGGLKDFLRTGGRTVPADANGTPITEYLARFAGYELAVRDGKVEDAAPVEGPELAVAAPLFVNPIPQPQPGRGSKPATAPTPATASAPSVAAPPAASSRGSWLAIVAEYFRRLLRRPRV